MYSGFSGSVFLKLQLFNEDISALLQGETLTAISRDESPNLGRVYSELLYLPDQPYSFNPHPIKQAEMYPSCGIFFRGILGNNSLEKTIPLFGVRGIFHNILIDKIYVFAENDYSGLIPSKKWNPLYDQANQLNLPLEIHT